MTSRLNLAACRPVLLSMNVALVFSIAALSCETFEMLGSGDVNHVQMYFSVAHFCFLLHFTAAVADGVLCLIATAPVTDVQDSRIVVGSVAMTATLAVLHNYIHPFVTLSYNIYLLLFRVYYENKSALLLNICKRACDRFAAD